MVYLKGNFVRATSVAFVILTIALDSTVEGGTTKIAYKKPINGKSNSIKEKRLKLKAEIEKTTTMATTTSLAATTVTEMDKATKIEGTTLPTVLSRDVEQTTLGNLLEKGEQPQIPATTTNIDYFETFTEKLTTENIEYVEKTQVEDEIFATSEVAITKDENLKEEVVPIKEEDNPMMTQVESTKATTTTESNLPVPCTCGVFMTSQIKRGAGSNEQPKGKPVILNELDRTYPCNAIGQKQCQTKCLETIVQHLPNSANILCATLNRDCRKERAYLFIKNCRNQWWNTSLAAGREYCCKNGQPYSCPMV